MWNVECGMRNADCGLRNSKEVTALIGCRKQSKADSSHGPRTIYKSAIRNPQSAFHIPHSTFRIPKSAFHIPHSEIRIPKSAFQRAYLLTCLKPAGMSNSEASTDDVEKSLYSVL